MVDDQEPRYRLVDSEGVIHGTLYAKPDGTLALQEVTSGANNEAALGTDGTLSVPGVDTESVSAEDLDTDNAVGAYSLANNIDLPNDTRVEINDWLANSDEIGSMADGLNWSPNRSGRYIVDLSLVVDGRLNGSTTNITVGIKGVVEIVSSAQTHGSWIDGGDRPGDSFSFLVDMTESDEMAFEIRHRSGQEEPLMRGRTNLEIIKVG